MTQPSREIVNLRSFKKPATITRKRGIAVRCKKELLATESNWLLPKARTVASLCWDYQRSVKYEQLSKESRRQKDYYLTLIELRWGDLAPQDITSPMVFALQEELSSTPGKSNCFISALSSLMKYGVQRGLVIINPASNIERLKTDEYKPWPRHVLQLAISSAAPMERLAITTALFTGQRISDCIALKHDWLSTGIVSLLQKKTKRTVFVPVHPQWQVEIAKVPRRSETLLYDRYGRPFKSTDTLRQRIKQLLISVGASDLTFHGLRKNATNHLAELGLTHHEIATITGMDIKTLMHYTKNYDALRVAERISGRLAVESPLPSGFTTP